MLEVLLVFISSVPIDFNFIKPMIMIVPLIVVATRGAALSVRMLLVYAAGSWAVSLAAIGVSQDMVQLRQNALSELVTVGAPIAIAALCPTIRLFKIVHFAAMISALVTIFQASVGLDPSGTWVNNAVNGCFLAVTSSLGLWGWPILAFAAIISKSSMAVGTALVVLVLRLRHYRIALVAVAVLSVAGMMAAGVSDTGRFGLWGLVIPHIFDAPIFGMGFGTIQGTLESLQNATGYMLYNSTLQGQSVIMGYFQNLHSEPLQVLAEGGAVGLILYVSVHVQALLSPQPVRPPILMPQPTPTIRLKNTIETSDCRIAIAACVACSLASPVWHWPMTAIIYAAAIKHCLDQKQ